MANSASDARHSEADIRKTLIEKNLIYAMLTLPSNMFYTVTLPATLWFFDKDKQDNKILFIDTRNVFTQIDRAHREFTEEQIQNIAIISRLHRGNCRAFVELVDGYYNKGFARLTENRPNLYAVSKNVISFLKENNGKDIPDFAPVLKDADKLLKAYQEYQKQVDVAVIDKANKTQRKLAETIAPFFALLHELLKEVDKKVRHIEKDLNRNKDLKALKIELEDLHKEAKATEYFFGHIAWLQERFREAKYEDVTGLCKLASLAEVKEQEYSLNPGRYVGVVIEEDGKTEEEFIEEMLALNDELNKLNKEAKKLEDVINHNIRQIAGD
jgi:type I restriction enzyme M protein